MCAFRIKLILLAAVAFSACAHTNVKEDGSTRITGFVSMSIAPTENPETFAGQVIEVNSIGLSGYRSDSDSGLTLGFFRLRSGFLKNNVEVIGDPMGIQ